MPPERFTAEGQRHARYWDDLAEDYQSALTVSLHDFHYGPLLPGDRELRLLPHPLQDKRCLELGCGAAQNSLYLASQGAHALAIDVSARQLDHARRLAEQLHLPLDLRLADMDALPHDLGHFDLIHSAYGLPFSADPQSLLRRCAHLLRPGGTLLLSLAHPVYAGEWLELDDSEQGIFHSDYFHPHPDLRENNAQDQNAACARAFPISESIQWILRAGLLLADLREPQALPVHTLSDKECRLRVPYHSPEWASQVHELRKFPIVLILKALKPT